MNTSLIRHIPAAVTLLVLFAAAARVFLRSRNISKRKLFGAFKNAEIINAWVLVFSMLLTCAYGVMYHINAKNSVYAVVSLNYSEASRALNSNGTRFNMAEMVCDEVLDKAIKQGAFENVTVNDLKKCVFVYPYVQGGVGSEADYHISTEYVIAYTASDKTRNLNAENVIKLVASAYKEYYTSRYTDSYKMNILGDETDLYGMEYMDVVAYFNKETTSLLNYLYGLGEKNSSFVTSENMTFGSIAGEIYSFRETQIEQNLRSLVLQHGIVRDKTEYTDRLTYRNTDIDFERQKRAASFALCSKAIAMYSEEMTRVVLVPTWDGRGKYYMGRTKVGIDELSVMATEYSDKVAENEKAVMDNNLIIGKIESSGENEEARRQADDLIASIDESIKAFAEKAEKAGREYSSHVMNQCVSVSINGHSVLGDVKMTALFGIFAYLSLLLFAVSAKIPKK